MHFLSIPLNCALLKLESCVYLTDSWYLHDATSKLSLKFRYEIIHVIGKKRKCRNTFPACENRRNYLYRIFSVIQTISPWLARMWRRSKIERAIASMFQFWRQEPKAATHKLFISWKSHNIVRGTAQSMTKFFKRQHGDILIFRRVSNALLSITLSFNSLYCVISFFFIVSHNGL